MPKKSKNKEASERKKGRKKKEESSLLVKENLERKEKEESFNVEVNLGERETLEELAETQEITEEASDFSEFVATSSEMPTLTLPSSTTPTAATNENLESAADSIGTTAISTNQPAQKEYLTVYNQPSYTGSTNEEKIVEGLRRSNRAVRTAEQLGDIKPRVEIEEWHETRASRERTRGENLRDYLITEVESREETSKKLPFEERKKYRELKR